MTRSRTVSCVRGLAFALVCWGQLARSQTALPTEIEQELQRRQEQEYRRLAWQMPKYSQADLDAWVRHYRDEMLIRLTGCPGTTAEYDAQVLEELPRRIDRLRANGLLKLPTPYEDPKTYLEMAILVQQIEDGMNRSLGANPVPRPVFGTLPTGEIEASVERFASGAGYLVKFESGLF